MRLRNWPLWGGLVLAVVAFFSYFIIFSRWVITRDVPWASYLLFVAATFLLIAGVRRAPRKIGASIVAFIGIAIFGIFVFAVTVGTKMLPSSHGAPRVGQKAPEFALHDTANRVVTLSALEQSAPKGVLLIFYRGYW